MPQHAAPSSVTQRIGRYEVLGHLASGGMAEILLARLVGPSGFERAVVVKRILPHLARLREFVDMFVDEARIVAAIRHPNVVHVTELGLEGAELFLVMEYLEGESVGGLVRRLCSLHEGLPASLAAHIVAEACAGLHAAHELTDADGKRKGLVHRDVSPQNVFITYTGEVKVLDFGIAKAADRITRTEAGQVKGKFEYMSPEQCLRKPLDRRSDIFALGVVLYELCTGHRLFKRENELSTLRAITEQAIERPSATSPAVPRALEEVCMRALARRPQGRYQTAAEMRRDLVSAARDLDGEGLPDEALALLMRRVFANRILEKRELLRRVRAGAGVTDIPLAEADREIDLPTMEEASVLRASTDVTPEERSKTGGWRGIALGLAVGAAAAATAASIWTRGSPPSVSLPSDVTASSERTSGAPAVAESLQAPPAEEIVLHVETTPPGATIFVAGRQRGNAPTDVRIPRSAEPLTVELSGDGLLPSTHAVTPDIDQRLVVTLSPNASPRPRGKSKPAAQVKPIASVDDEYHRFD